jgi:hypothetical protein
MLWYYILHICIMFYNNNTLGTRYSTLRLSRLPRSGLLYTTIWHFCNIKHRRFDASFYLKQRAILNFTPDRQGRTSPQGWTCPPGVKFVPIGEMLTPSFTPRGEHYLLFIRMEGRAENFTPTQWSENFVWAKKFQFFLKFCPQALFDIQISFYFIKLVKKSSSWNPQIATFWWGKKLFLQYSKKDTTTVSYELVRCDYFLM